MDWLADAFRDITRWLGAVAWLSLFAFSLYAIRRVNPILKLFYRMLAIFSFQWTVVLSFIAIEGHPSPSEFLSTAARIGHYFTVATFIYGAWLAMEMGRDRK